ncbi:MAG: DUF4198 domain-containing protein [Victivallaceae bacterium]
MYRKLFAAVIVSFFGMTAFAHFQVIKVPADKVENINLPFNIDLIFTHPFHFKQTMTMKPPVAFGVLTDGVKTSLLNELKPANFYGKTGFNCSYKFKAPGNYIFYVEPAPYWEPAERKYIIHYTKVVVDVLASGDGWDKLVGFPVEIEPLTRPYSIYAGNSFSGIVKKKGKPVPYATVEVEYYNSENRLKASSELMSPQVIKADMNGVFTYTMPVPGWWGFAALLDGDKQVAGQDGKPADVEQGGVIWINAEKIN